MRRPDDTGVDRCERCDFTYDELPADQVPTVLREQPSRYAACLRRAEVAGVLRTRPAPGTWSALEYACHVRDVLQVQGERVHLALVEDTPTFTPMGREERPVTLRYNEQDLRAVLTDLGAAAEQLAATYAALDDERLLRTAVYNWPETSLRTIAWIGRHTVHEALHHRDDIDRGIAQLRAG